ncbi:MAG: hypothetical protein IBJ03_04660 [Gemmatimonadaceae bacterium]|nr:hypothetical protein [Gemmatimonadaceae bacterium]
MTARADVGSRSGNTADSAALLAQVARTQRTLVRDGQVHVLLLILGAALAATLLWRALLVAWPLAAGARWLLRIATVAVACLAVLYARWHTLRNSISLPRVALWMEEQGAGTPTHTLVTWVERALQSNVPSPAAATASDIALEQAARRELARVPVDRALSQRRWSLWRGSLSFALGALALLIVVPQMAPSLREMAASAGVGGKAIGGESARANPLGRWQVTVTPPAYTGRASASYEDVTSVQALSGSRVSVSGDGDSPQAMLVPIGGAADSSAITQDKAVAVSRAPDDDAWRLQIVANESPQALRVSRGGTSRLLIVEGVRDSVPRVTLELPARDSVFRAAVGELPLLARAHDDLGVARAHFELIVSSGEGERFTVRTVTVAAQQFGAGARDVTWRGVFNLAAYQLQPGDVVHLRAVARDAHPLASREFGSSETRAFRIARAAEYDSVAVEPAPPPAVDSSLLSQRMLLMLTQKLDARQRRLTRAEVVRESLRLAKDQARLRLAVGDVVFQRLSGESSAEHAHYAGDGHDHGVDAQGGKLAMGTNSTSGMLEEGNDSPIVAINKPLLEAYNAMWDAGRALEQGDPHGAIPAMERALEAIERSRAASRLYLRGRPPQVIVDIAKVRLIGKDTGQTLPRSARVRLAQQDAQRDARLVRAVEMAAARPENAGIVRDSLALLRAESLADAPAFAGALARVLDALAGGNDITVPVMEARRVLGNVQRGVSAPWGSGGTP